MTGPRGSLHEDRSSRLSAVLFDMDGTLVETEEHWGQALFALAERLGGRLSAEARQATVGSSMRTSMQILYRDIGVSRTEAQLLGDARWVEDTTAVLLAEEVTWRPGAADLLVSVREAGLATALVTTTPRRLADIVLTAMREDLGSDPFDLTLCGDEVPARKPDPAPYLMAMDALGVLPAECVVVEDSQAGIAAGLAAGTAVLGVPTLQLVPPASGLSLRDGLVGLGAAELADLLAEIDLTDSAA
ncbi:MAG TPA: HAD family phosphatase [Blastococcus sp.]|nr:HAD family phosphatase [Blastococcus sp.]